MEELETLVANTEIREQTEGFYGKAFFRVAAMVSRLGGSLDDAKDIFHDAWIIYFETLTEKNLEVYSGEAYILGIAKHLWNRKFTRFKKNIPLDAADHKITIPDDYYPSVQNKRLLRYLEKAGKKCMDLLRAFYYERIPAKKLASGLGYANEHSVSVQKYKCLGKVREIIKQKSLTYEDFLE